MVSIASNTPASKKIAKETKEHCKKEARQKRRKKKWIAFDKKQNVFEIQKRKGTDPEKWNKQESKIFLQYKKQKSDSKMPSILTELWQHCKGFDHPMSPNPSPLKAENGEDDQKIDVGMPEAELDVASTYEMGKV